MKKCCFSEQRDGTSYFRSAFARCGPIELRVKSWDGVFQMPKVPSENYERIVAALGRLGFVVVRQRGSHIRLEKLLVDGTLKITVPAHRPVKRSTLAKILKQADISLPDFLNARYSLTHAPVAAGVAEVARLQIGTLASSATVV